jgi:hypothetical protein
LGVLGLLTWLGARRQCRAKLIAKENRRAAARFSGEKHPY